MSAKDQLHVIEESGDLKDADEIKGFLSSHLTGDVLSKVGLRYRVVGVLGGQSSGKSTLLNHVFETDFAVMNQDLGRTQTTRGAFLSKSNMGKNIFVLDFEGTDGIEHGEDQSFERQLSLFALSVADVLIVNMWSNEVGRFNAANLALLRAIFEVNLQLFAHMPQPSPQPSLMQRITRKGAASPLPANTEKPTLLFVLRDYVSSQTTLDKMIVALRRSLTKVWEGVTKPPRLADCDIEDLFELQFFAFPHLIYERTEFDEAVVELRNWFSNSQHERFLFKLPETFRGIPLSDLPQYLHSCWKSIVTSRDLNIPSQREMLAVCRCTEALAQLKNEFEEFSTQLRNEAKSRRPIYNLSSQLEKKIATLLDQFADVTKLYARDTVEKYEQRLRRDLNEMSIQLLRYQACIIVVSELTMANSAIQRIVDTACRNLSIASPASNAPTTSDDSSHEDPNEKRSEVSAVGRLSVVRHKVESQNLLRIKEFWRSIRLGILEVVAQIQTRLEKGINLDSDVDCALVSADQRLFSFVTSMLKQGADNKVFKRIESMSADASTAMTKTFDHALQHDADGNVRFFATVKGLKTAFAPARHAGMLLLGCLFASRLDADSEDPLYDELSLRLGAEEEHIEPVYPSANAEVALKKQQALSADLTPSVLVKMKNDSENMDVERLETDEVEQLTRLSQMKSPEEKTKSHDREEESTVSRGEIGNKSAIPPVLVLMAEGSVSRAYELYHQSCQFAYKLQRHTIESNKPHIPLYIFVALLLLGANEAYWVATSPPLLLFVIIVIYFFFRDWVVNQWQTFRETAPAHVVVPIETAVTYIKKLVPSITFLSPRRTRQEDAKKTN